MSTQGIDNLYDRCPKCGAVICYNEELQAVRCGVCGREFLTIEFAGERLKMEKSLKAKDELAAKLQEAERETKALQTQLTSTFSVLDAIGQSQEQEAAALCQLMGMREIDQRSHDAMLQLLLAMQEDHADAINGLLPMLKAVMTHQTSAEDKLQSVSSLIHEILQAQHDGALQQASAQDRILERLESLHLNRVERH
ncbi:MAG: hypothetical protein IKK21_10005, partial [Clostridia bacterium]|nr:hypothetical protein [Clostridia bacterium]